MSAYWRGKSITGNFYFRGLEPKLFKKRGYNYKLHNSTDIICNTELEEEKWKCVSQTMTFH